MFQRIEDFHDWLGEQERSHSFRVRLAPLDELAGWSSHPELGTIRHSSGRFFSIDGLTVGTGHGPTRSWAQPIIVQPESGILGILVKRFGGVPHFLLQAKMEPGNVRPVQLSPTVQATRSNYTRVHGGKPVPYLEYFQAPRQGRMIADVLQSEQGSWFLHKRNRNMLVEVTGDVPVLPGFCWLTGDQIGELMLIDNLINMDTRTVLSGFPSPKRQEPSPGDDAAAMSWFTEAKERRTLTRKQIPLNEVKGWLRSPERISHELDRYFSVIGVTVEIDNREVTGWDQPMIAPCERGIVAFLARRAPSAGGTQDDGELQLLVQVETQAGTLDVVEIAPTVQCAPGNYDADRKPPFLDHVLSAPASRRLLDVVYSEEGGRLYHAENRYLIVEVGDDFPDHAGEDFLWMDAERLAGFGHYGNHVNVEARSLMACLRFLDLSRKGGTRR
ncbi:NDP-hexose 2,3-dehydratase family protein [Streptosporangium sp. NPDC051023]|uniref:NDP-hexose 2,3-dehydratase family protein n=1 Tax=Streptosporangium sp. NPDC051023 TaxID=3155410 RepID=UPI003450CFE0